MAKKVGVDAFLAYVAAEMSWDMPVSAATELDEDLCVDSVARYELLCVVEDLGVVLDEGQLGDWQTVGDLYAAYAAAPASGSAAGQPVEQVASHRTVGRQR